METKEILIGTEEELVEHFATFVRPMKEMYTRRNGDPYQYYELQKTIKEQLDCCILKKRDIYKIFYMKYEDIKNEEGLSIPEIVLNIEHAYIEVENGKV